MEALDKKDWICTQPFEFAEIFDHKTYMCCPNWLPVDLGNPNNIAENWQSDKAEKIRNSMLDGSYSYCIESRCPKLTGLKEGKTEGFIHRDDFLKRRKEFKDKLPTSLKFNFDQSCNLKCPSCRTNFINYEGKERVRTEELINNIETQLGEGLKHIECTGSGDPFFSRTFRKWMMRFDPSLYPKLHSIHLHTNATLWNKSNWERMPNIHSLVKSCEISVDACTKDTYENKTRLGGKWDPLLENLKYIANIPSLNSITLSFVVQDTNYTEMEGFYNLAASIFSGKGKNWSVFYNRVVNWGTMSDEQFTVCDVGNPEHPNYNDLLTMYRALPMVNNIRHNLTVV